MKKAWYQLICIGFVLILGCEKKDPLPLTDFYSYLDIRQISLRSEQTDYYLGTDSLLVPQVNALDSLFRPRLLPDSVFTFFLNGQRVPSNRFVFTRPGSQTIAAQFGERLSNDLIVQVIDPVVAVKTIQLTLAKSSGVPFLVADGVSRLRVNLLLLDSSGKPLPDRVKLTPQLRANGQPQPVATQFQTRQPGAYRLTASIFGKESNVLDVRARPVETYPVVKIPVIFHFMQVQPYDKSYDELLKATTTYYRKTAARLEKADDPSGVDAFIEFEPAQNDPSGKPLAKAGEDWVTTGPLEYTSEDMIGAAFKNHFWNPNAYLNVYVFTCTTCASDGAAGFAVGLPPLATDGWDRNTPPSFAYGTYVDNKPGYLNPSLLAHEFGHMLALPHTFNGGGNNDDPNPCDKDADDCEDTPLYARRLQPPNLESFEEESCSGQRYFATNPMNYGGFPVSFTYNQRQRMRNRIDYGLWLPTPQNKGRGGRRAALNGSATGKSPLKPTIWICPPDGGR